MVDRVDISTRSRIMAKVRATNTSPEVALRKELFRLGFRYRLHCGELPGRPDIVLPRYQAVIFVNGCFWHWHGCRAQMPATNALFWQEKIDQNKKRDIKNYDQLLSSGWRVLVVWECALKARYISEATKLTSEWLYRNNIFSIIAPEPKSKNSQEESVLNLKCENIQLA